MTAGPRAARKPSANSADDLVSGASRSQGYADRVRDRGGNIGSVDDGGEVDEPHPARTMRELGLADRDGQPRLANSSDRSNRDEAVLGEQPADPRQVVFAANETRRASREVRPSGVDDPQRRERAIANLEQTNRFGNVTQTMRAEIDRVADRSRESYGLRGEHLTAVAGGLDACRRVDDRPEVIAGALLGLTEMQTHANQQRRPRPRRIGECSLCLRRGAHRVSRASERSRERIAGRREHVPAVRLDRRAQNRVVHLQRR
jgi:hypothetical protein